MFWYKLLLLTLQEKIYAWLRYNWYVLCVPRDFCIWRREPGETKVACSLGQNDSPGRKVLEERSLVEKKVPLVISVLVLSLWSRKRYLVSGVQGRCQRRSWRRVSKVAPVSRFRGPSVGEGFWFCVLMFRCSRACQRPESMLLYGVGYLGLFGLRLLKGPWSVQGCLLKLRTWRKSIWWVFFS